MEPSSGPRERLDAHSPPAIHLPVESFFGAPFWRPILQALRDPDTVAAIIDALRHVYGDSLARLMLIEGMTLSDLIDALLRSPIKNREAVKLVTQALGSDDFLIEPEILGPSHIAYLYDPPGSLHVVDIAIDTTRGRLASASIRLRLRDPDKQDPLAT